MKKRLFFSCWCGCCQEKKASLYKTDFVQKIQYKKAEVFIGKKTTFNYKLINHDVWMWW